MAAAVPQPSRDAVALLAAVEDAQAKLTQLEATSRGLIEELAASGAQATPRLRELLASGERLVAAVTAVGGKLAPHLPSSNALPGAPDRAAVEAVWARELQPQAEGAAGATTMVPTPAGRPAATLQELASTLAALPGCRLALLRGRASAAQPEEAGAVLLYCGRAFAAVVHLQSPGGLQPLRVGVLSTAEATAAMAAGSGDPLGGSSGSLWAPSQHAVFQQLSVQAVAALEHFLQQSSNGGGGGASTLELLLLWLATCSDVFTRRATDANALLLADPAAGGAGLLPPLRRPYEGQGWEALWTAALNPHLRTAEHLATGSS